MADSEVSDNQVSRAMRALLVVSIALPLVLYAGVSWHLREQHLKEGVAHVGQTVRMLEEHALRVLEAQQLIIDRVDQRIAGMDWDTIRRSSDIHRFLKGVAAWSPHVDGLWLVPPDGRTANSADFFPFPDLEATDRRYFQALKERDQLYFGEMIVGKTKGTRNFNLSRRRSPRDTFDGLILVTSSIAYFSRFWADASSVEGKVAGLFRTDGEILAQFPSEQRVPQRLGQSSPLFRAIQRNDDGVYRSDPTADEPRRIYGYSRVGNLPIFIGFGVDEAAILAGWRSNLAWHGLIAFVAAALLGGAVLVALRQSDHLHAAVVSWRTTAGELRREVDRRLRAEDVAVEQERLLSQVREARGQRETILDNMVEGVAAYSDVGEVIYCNEAARRILRLGPYDAPTLAPLAAAGRLERSDGTKIEPTDTPVQRLLRGEQVRQQELRLRFPGAATLVVCSFRGAPFLDQHQRVTGAVLTFLDVTERREEEERRALLMAELDHRVRNMLATINAMVWMTSKSAPSHDALVETLTGRIQAMARTHGLITKSGWRGAELGQIVGDEVHSYSGDDRVAISGEDEVLLPPKEAVDLALVLHELATNAAKHGAWSSVEGRVEISWRIEADTVRAVHLVWRERGGPTVAEPTVTGFGTRLIGSAFRGKNGSVDLRFEPEGVVCELRIPLSGQPKPEPGGQPAPAAGGPSEAPARLDGLRVLVAEDEAIVRMELVSSLQQAGAIVVGPVATVAAALALADEADCDCAVLDVNLDGEHSGPVAERLLARHVPVLFATGYSDLSMLPPALRDVPRLQKPLSRSDLVRRLAAAAPGPGRGTGIGLVRRS